MTEPSQVLDTLFRLCYPLDDPPLETIDHVGAVLEAALKYELRKAIQMTSRRLRELIPSAPLRVYAIACKLSLEDEARAAAVVVREKNVQHKYVEELEDIPIGAYLRLLYFCETGRDPGGLFFSHRSSSPRSSTTKKKKSKSSKSAAGGADSLATSVSVPLPPSSLSEAPTPSPPPTPPRGAYPFDRIDCEVEFETSDGVRFGVSKDMVSLSSPVLYALIRDLPVPARVTIPESSKVTDTILRICSPVESPSGVKTLDLDSALAAATKYKMPKAIQFLRRALLARADTDAATSLLLYAVACRHGMHDLALVAAKRTFRMELTSSLYPKVEAINISAGYLYRLFEYRRRCRDAVRAILDVNKTDWIDRGWQPRLATCCLSTRSTLPCWYGRYIEKMAGEDWPGPASVVKQEVLQAALVNLSWYNCSYCLRENGAILLYQFGQYVAETILKLEDQVALEWPPEVVVGKD
ncbi:hypothetical protein BD311DRAFT_683222 [Dichomitus squalens]|uniref:BTB domain-containing protein n=1 Tax=Dichomitus squalens TaxID=114155 RepID=A0A4Q9N5D2_9APHY|nr:hypothetical protein BD311DRAFT_683222 [Dichomitus squalens]